jgi:HTH-type transcriptional repressor of NAD biosynthesis genes
MLTVSLLGGESSGKSTLARQLHAALLAQGIHSALVPEHLRDWCEAAGRAPLAHEQAAIATEQTRLIEATRARVVIADTTALMVAAYSELYFNDRSLWPEALAAQRRMGLTLLMGLDLPWVSDGFFRDSPAVREATDTVLRRELQGAGIGFQTVYGQGTQRLRAALRAVGAALGRELLPDDPLLREGSGRWQCEACSDPDCEHRLFSALLARRGGD